ncbi:hypothetical protein BJ322DRAFT_8617 [Thelephora terrestris]|uniref:Uncharacterized protein n=1 Tax=Thelephora terrestris TaxID=56493 RepID=A0A9P6HP23_9AGAM|nr:hypothetical protein BJ322DRAFT_8617 [Thelephora terrestris]
MASNMSNSTTIVADSTDDLGTSSRARNQGWVAIPRGHGPVFPQHDYDDIELEPTIYDTSHVDLTQVPAQGPPRPGPPRGKPRLQITTIAPVRSRNSNSPGTAFYTPGGSGEVVDRRPFDSAAAIRVIYSTSSSRPSDSAGPFRRVVRDVLQGSARYQFPIQRTPVSRSDPRATTDAPPRHGFRTSFLRPPRNVAGSPRFFSGASASTTPGHESGLSSGSRLASLDEREDVGTSRDASIFPRMGGRRVVPSCDGGDGTAEDERTKKGKETDDWSHMSSSTDYVDVVEESSQGKTPTSANTVRAGLRRKSGASASTTPGSRDPSTFPQGDGRRVVPSCDGREGTAEDERTKKGIEIDDCSHMSNSTDYVSVSGEVEESSQDKAGSKRTPRNAVSAATQRPSFESSPIRYLLKKITRKSSKPQHCAQTQVQNDHPSPSMSMATIESIDTPVAGSGQGRERKFSEISTFLGGLVGAKKKGSKRDVRLLTKSKR